MNRKIINDPVYGFITIDNDLIFQIVNHPWYQRLRRIHQMALAQLVYPGAVHTRLQHSLGAYHLMRYALFELKQKGVEISETEETGAKIAILLHDIGHGPFSHALEGLLTTGVHHETLSMAIMNRLNDEFNGRLQTAIEIFKGVYPKKFLHQLVSGQLDVDRMDYLNRDSFFSGVSEGTIAYDRILKMITVHQGNLMVEEKAIFSIEKFLTARRLMYWQVYLHKTVIVAEKMLQKIISRVRDIGADTNAASLNKILLFNRKKNSVEEILADFCSLDDYDLLAAIKAWMHHPDYVLQTLSRKIINRELFKIRYYTKNEIPGKLKEMEQEVLQLGIPYDLLQYFVFSGSVKNSLYKKEEEKIQILFKNGVVKDISQVDNPLVHKNLATAEQKYYICYVTK
jgi:HD superfamily phosphohydrolase